MRVAVRRLRAVLSVFRRAIDGRRLAFEDDLRWLQDKLGAVRDWDVFRAGVVQPIEGQHLTSRWSTRRAKRRATMPISNLRLAWNSRAVAALWRR